MHAVIQARRGLWFGFAWALGLILAWGFTVDDAWIVARVAYHGAANKGFCFNVGAPTDAVTPLGFERVLSLARFWSNGSGPLTYFQFARFLGLASSVVAAFLIGFGARLRGGAALVQTPLWVIAGFPALIWAGAGLSTSLVGLGILVGSMGVTSRGTTRRKLASAVLLGCCAAWRPETTFFSGALLSWKAFGRYQTVFAGCSKYASLPLFALPSLCVGAIRWWTFGHILPLSAIAKEPHLPSGIRYSFITLIWFSLGWAVLSSRACRKQGFAGAYLAHLLGLVLIGGDWMPAFRLTAAVTPTLLHAVTSQPGSTKVGFARALVVALVPAWFFFQQGPDLRAVMERRLSLVQAGKDALAGARVVATVDVGWVGWAHPELVVDLGGVTDPKIGRLPGGHTSKPLAPGLFSDRNVDAWVVRDARRDYQLGHDLSELVAVYAVDARLLRRVGDLGLVPCATLNLPGTAGQYVIFRR